MSDVYTRLREVGVFVPDILLPRDGVDYGKFSVVACDQFSAQPEYWLRVEELVGDAPSTLHMIMPEAFLNTRPNDAARINSCMSRYLEDGTLKNVGKTCVLVRRQTTTGVRLGLVLALDLEQYDFSRESKSLIRATEQTVVERLPARIEIRSGAPLELPHVLVLIDDKKNELMPSLDMAKGEKLYDFDLMMNGGRIEGYRLGEDALGLLADGLHRLLEQSESGMLFAMGDGNHSFAAAKRCWDTIKATLTPEQRENHPARFSLVELENLYDEALEFEPIHRVLFRVDPEELQREVGFDAANPPSLQELQPRLDEWLAKHHDAEIEYIHGEQECRELGSAPDALSIIFPPFDKSSLFDVVVKNGCFVRKSFSMGTARDKRYYLEAKLI